MEDSEAMSIKSTQTGKSRKTEKSGKSGKSGLTKNPFGYSVLMAVNFGVMLYNYFPGEETEKAEKLDLVACDLPSNVKTIIEALGSYRDDLPTRKAFQRYCVVAAQLASAPKESEVEKLFAQFLDPSSRDDANHIHGRRNLVTSPGMLPLDQTKVMPDMCAGIKPFHLKGRTWVGKYLEGIVANKTMIIVNGIVEYKSSEGSISAAVSRSLCLC